MSQNTHKTAKSQVMHACVVPEGTKSGDVLRLGEHLTVWAVTDRATAETVKNGTAAQNLEVGQATCELQSVGTTVKLLMKGSGERYGGVNRAADGTYGAGDGDLIGVALEGYSDGETVPVALRSF